MDYVSGAVQCLAQVHNFFDRLIIFTYKINLTLLKNQPCNDKIDKRQHKKEKAENESKRDLRDFLFGESTKISFCLGERSEISLKRIFSRRYFHQSYVGLI